MSPGQTGLRVETAAYFAEKAAQCRRLATNVIGDPVHDGLIRLAEEFEANAAAYIARERAAHAIGVGDDVMPTAPRTPSTGETDGGKNGK